MTPLATLALIIAATVVVPSQLPTLLSSSTVHHLPHGILSSARALVVRRPSNDSDRLISWVHSIAADLRAGLDPNSALTEACNRTGIASGAKQAVRLHDDISRALQIDARRDGRLLHSVAALWSVQEINGSGLSRALDAIADTERATAQARHTINAELATTRATTRMMIGLPALGVVFSWALGANPLGWLFGTQVGMLTLAIGLALNLAGALWTHSFVNQATSHL